MAHDIFISYSTKDKQAADAICHALESNGLRCWIAPRNIRGGEEYAKEIMDGLEAAKIIVLVFSKNSQNSIFVTNEIANAFEKNKPIISYKIDETLPENKMEYYLKNKHWLDAYPDYERLFKTLVRDAKRLCDIKTPPHEKDYKIPILIGVALIFLVAVGFMMLSGNDTIETDSTNSSGTDIVIDYVGMDDDRDKGYSWKYSYFAIGSIPSELTNSSKDVVHIDFYDSSGKIVQSNDTNVKDIEGNILGSAYVNDDNIEKVSVELRDGNGKVLSSAESNNIVNNG